ncbi:MAG: NAD(+)/NADH kinase [Clostridiales bacterium]|nr:NAD(+)/NADH kinase [Clostridiales bacterium]
MKIAILPNLNKNDAHKHTVQIIRKLLELKADILMFSRYQDYFNCEEIVFYQDFYEMVADCDVMLAIGGDGTIIHAAKHAAIAGKPLLGINLGRIGFVAGLELNELDRLKDLVDGDYHIEKRMMLEVAIQNQEKSDTFYALNDAVISRGSLSRMIDLNVGFHDNKISHYRADGLIISTPTGSTAYSLSAGGPVIEPVMRCMLLTPICSHSLFSRSVLFGEDARLSVQAPAVDDNEIFLTIDGETSVQLDAEDTVQIQAAAIQVHLIKIKDISFYEVLNEKLSERRI